MRKNSTCPCGTQQPYETCCQPYHQGVKKVTTAEILMRSRYSAFVFNLTNYLRTSWHPQTCPVLIEENNDIKWLQLIIREAYDGSNPNEAFVRFEARYSVNGKAEKLKELSRFLKINDQWVYIDGAFE